MRKEDSFVLAVRDSLKLQNDKVNHLYGRVDPLLQERQNELLKDTFYLYHDSVDFSWQTTHQNDPVEYGLFGWFFLLLVVWGDCSTSKT